MKVALLDYGVGNLGSVARALEELRVSPVLVTRAIDMHSADCLILPGVGNFADCARLLRAGGWDAALREEVLSYSKPLLGICVGMQLLADFSTEGADDAPDAKIAGLGLVPGKVEHLARLGCSLRIPHVGWNGVTKQAPACSLLAGIPDGTDFYFVHSYAFLPENQADSVAGTDYGVPVTAAVQRGKVFGTQFHPEKSSRAGYRVLGNFIQCPPC
jgi:imidazole glycerol-phosphate synthase subunit HisH